MTEMTESPLGLCMPSCGCTKHVALCDVEITDFTDGRQIRENVFSQ